ncbi:MAG: 4Fe-4S dicluster domain-containing protein, partial [bacterium]|nr:4Fe-4S dicluster domain-containing protein [bacterium]
MFGRLVGKIVAPSPICTRAHLCVRVRYPMASCRLCLSTCPAGAIEIEEEQVNLTDACLDCRACVAACPAGVFHLP